MSVDYKYDEKTNSYIPVQEEDNKYNISEQDKLIAIVAWAIQYANAVILPVLAVALAYSYYNDKKNIFLTETLKEVLNFQINIIIYMVVFGALSFLIIGIPLLFIAVIYAFVIPIFGIIEASNHKVYRPPFMFKFIQ